MESICLAPGPVLFQQENDLPGRESLGPGCHLPVGCLLSLPWLGFPWGGIGEGREKPSAASVCNVCEWGRGGWEATGAGTLAESVRQVDPADGHGDAFTSASCSLPILNTKSPQGMLPLFWGPLRWSLSWGMQDGVGVLTGAGVGTWAVASSKT